MLDYPAMRAVALVAQTGSFEKAAQVLCVTPSAVSQRIKQLEERLGVVLIVRGNPCVATEKGSGFAGTWIMSACWKANCSASFRRSQRQVRRRSV
ncbi:chromosome replication initiation inhibitor protein [Agrobacterium tumefaciens]|nr:chromosome replication initiation inhibitor protein [Agrobacterium tumefaciens]